MKIKWLLLVFFGLLTLSAQAQLTVVRIQNHRIYLDTSSAQTPVKKGDTFKVILSSEKLTNPKTGKELGLLYNYSEPGVITEVQPLYAVGKLPSEKGVEIGQDAVIESAPTNTQTAETKPQQESSSSQEIQKITYEPIGQEVAAITTGAVSAPEADNIITLSNKGQLSVWNRAGENLQEVTSYQLPVGKAPLSVSAAKVRGKETAEVFVSVYEENLSRISTLVLAYENGQWTTLATLPYFVKETGCTQKTVWMQRPFVLGARPGNARNLVYQDGKFTAGELQIATRHNWLSGLNLLPTDKNEEKLIFTTPGGQIKLEPSKGKTSAYKDFSVGAPNRVKYKQEMVKFYPALQVLKHQGRTQAAVVENTTTFGLLSGTFGQYSGGKIHFLAFEKGRLTPTQTVDMDGFMYDTACTPAALVTAEVLQDGKSSIVEILN